MSDVRLTPQVLSRTGQVPSYTALGVGDTFQVRLGEATVLHFKKSGAGDATVTLVTPRQVGGLDVDDPVVVVPATTGDVMVGNLSSNLYADGAGDLTFSVDEDTGLTCAVVEA